MASFLSNRGIYSMAINQDHITKPARMTLLVLLMITLFCSVAGLTQAKKSAKAPAVKAPEQAMPVTTSSAAAARYFENGMVHYENHRWNLALNDWREAVKLDPKFALAYTWICMTTVDPAEESSNRALAKATMKDVSPDEQLMVRWMVDTHESRYVEGIAAMN